MRILERETAIIRVSHHPMTLKFLRRLSSDSHSSHCRECKLIKSEPPHTPGKYRFFRRLSCDSQRKERYELQPIDVGGFDLISGHYPPEIEEKILFRMNEIALAKLKQGEWKESMAILKKILEAQIELFGPKDTNLAPTYFHIGIAKKYLYVEKSAFYYFSEAINILSTTKHSDKNLILADAYYEGGVILGCDKDFDNALNYLEQAKQIELHATGKVKPRTLQAITKYQRYKKNPYNFSR